MEQEKIDVTRATPVSPPRAATGKAKRRGAPLWLQLLLSLIVVALAVGVAALFNPIANTMLANVGLKLPQLNAAAADTSAPTAQGGDQRQGQGQQGAAQSATGAPAGQRQGQGQGQGQGGFAGRAGARVSVVVAQPVTQGLINNQLTSIGDSTAIHSVTVTFPSTGTLTEVDVKPGDQVKAGTKLAALDSGSQQIAYDKAQLASQDADAALSRAQSLAKSNNLSDSALATAQLASAQAKLAVNDAKLDLDQRTITAPVDGSIGLIQVSIGNQINAQSVVTTIEDSSQILINFYVPERYSSQIKVGDSVSAESGALAGKTFTGTITAIDNKIDPDSRTLSLQATLPNSDSVIKAGMSFTVDMKFPGETFAAVDPLSIQWSNQGAYVWKIADTKVQKAMVEIVQRNTDGVLVKGAVQPGDQVVTQGVLQLTDGASIRLLDSGGTSPSIPSGPTQGATTASGNPGGASSAPSQGSGQYKRRQDAGASASSAPAAAGG